MKYSLSLLLAAATAYALPTEVLDKRAVDATTLSTLSFYEQYAAAAYCVSNNQAGSSTKVTCNGNCPQVQSNDANTVLEFQNQGTADATGFVAVDKTKRQIVIAYRGSHSVLNWLGNVDFKKVPFLCSGCEVHQGFLSSWTSTKTAVTNAVNAAFKANPGFSIVATGHSLGAAIATLAAADLRSQGKKVSLYTYGSPEVGNVAFATSVSNSGPTFRVTHQKDAVPYLAGYVVGYAHTFPEYWITSGNGVPVGTNDITVINKGTQPLEGNENPDNFPGSISNHLWYFNSVAGCAPSGFELTK